MLLRMSSANFSLQAVGLMSMSQRLGDIISGKRGSGHNK
jgi:hypothetical protein